MSDDTLTVWVAGATGGIGSALIPLLVQDGWTIAASARSRDSLQDLAAGNNNLLTLPCDARDPSAVQSAADQVFEHFGRLDAYVHLPGSMLLKPAHLLKDEEWHEVIELNLTSAFYALRAVVSQMQRQGSGALVFLSSVAARTGLASHEAIAAAKAGIEGLVRSAAASYASRHLRFNAIAPGLVETPLSRPFVSTEQSRAISSKLHPLGRIGQPAEIAAAIRWLISTDASWVTGQVISIDGGLSTVHLRPRV